MEKNFEKNNENCVEFLSGEIYCGCTFTNRKHINRMKSLRESHGKEFKSYVENPDGSIFCKIPLRWIKINPDRPKRVYTDEQKDALRERFKKARMKMQKNKESDGTE